MRPTTAQRSALAMAATVVIACLVLTCSRATVAVHAAEPQVTWNRDVAPIVFEHCTTCHHSGGGAPFELTTYAQAARWSRQMATVTASRYMPPWLPEAGHGDFAGDRHLPQRDIELIAAWVKQGAPEGDTAAPAAPRYPADWSLGPPDLVLTMPVSVPVPASGQDIFLNFILPAGVDRTRWVRAMEIKPGPPALTHHANVILDPTQSLRRAHPDTWRNGVPGMDLSVDAGETFDPESHFLFWKPDSTALVEPEGMPWRLDPGTDLILNMHLKPTGKAEQVQARIGLYFTDKPATGLPMLLQLEDDAALDVPPGDADFVVSDQLTLPVSVDVLGIYPHAHYLGKRLEAWATLLGGSRRDLILIRDWDIDRQSVYRYAKPIALPKGSVLHMRYVYDNSAGNVRNPSSPPIRVRAGNRSTDEMAHCWLQVLPRPDRDGQSPGVDPRLVLEQAWMQARLRKNARDTIALYNLASAFLSASEPTRAVALLRELATIAPQDVRAHIALGSALEAAGNDTAAQAEFERAIALSPEDPDARFDLASLELRRNDAAGAEENLRTLLAVHPRDAGALTALGKAQMAQGQNDAARDSFARAEEIDPSSDDAVAGFAQAALAAGRPEMAQDALRKALSQRDSAALRRLLATSLAALGDGAGALVQLRAWAKLAPVDPEPHRAIAQVLGALGEDEAAVDEQQRVVQLAPSSAADWNDLGVMEARAGKREQARRDLTHALQLDPSNAQAKANLAKL